MSGNRGKLNDKMIAAQWKPGQSGNPSGRPRRESFEAIVARILDEKVPGSDTRKREALARVFVDMLLKRNGQMMREYLAREWPATQKVEASFPEGVPLRAERFKTPAQHRKQLGELLESEGADVATRH